MVLSIRKILTLFSTPKDLGHPHLNLLMVVRTLGNTLNTFELVDAISTSMMLYYLISLGVA